MSTETTELLDEVIAECIRAEDAGEPLDREKLLAEHSEIATDLREFFADRDRMKSLARPLAPGTPRRQFVPPKIRYFGDYELLEEVARGGMGVVYKALQTSLKRTVAVKMILSGQLAGPGDLRRFRREAEAAAKLQHPHIVAIHEIGQVEGRPYFSMDYVQGRDLARVMAEGPLVPREAARCVKQAAEAINYAHEQGVLHRDMKPANILIDRDDQVRITDFGLAGWIGEGSSLTRSGEALGTPGYAPPEQVAGRKSLVGPASDVYALGAVLYELLTARPPFQGNTPAETLQRVLTTEVERPRRISGRIPRDLEAICLKCLEKEPHCRYATAGLLAEDLDGFIQGKPIGARALGRRARIWRWCRRNRALAGLGGLALLLIAVLSVSVAATIVRGWTAETAVAIVPESATYELREVLGFRAHRDGAVTIAVSLDGKLLATGANNELGVVRLWELETGRLVAQLRGHTLGVVALAFSSEGDVLASGSRDGTARLWDVPTGHARLTTPPFAGPAQFIAFAGRRLLVGVPDQSQPLSLFNVETGELIEERMLADPVQAMAVAPDDKTAAIGYATVEQEQSLELLSMNPGLRGTPVSSHAGGTASLTYSPDGRWLASGGAEGGLVLWETGAGRPISLGRLSAPTARMAFSRDGALLATLSHAREESPAGEISVWDLQTRQRIAVANHDDTADIAFALAGDAIVAGVGDGGVRIWRLMMNGEPYSGRKTPVGRTFQGDAARAMEAESIAEMEQRFLSLTATEQHDGSDGSELRPIMKPLHRFSERNKVHDGSVWAWEARGRPIAVAALERYDDFWSYELLSLSTEPNAVAVVAPDGWRWAPDAPGIQYLAFDDSASAAAGQQDRYARMNQIARRCEVSRTVETGKREELRLLDEPLLRLAPLEDAAIDGAIFIYAKGANPEVLLFVECRQQREDSSLTWRYAFAPLTSAIADARLDGRVVWSKPHQPTDTKTQEPYALFREPHQVQK